MRFTFDEIKKDLLDNWENITEAQHYEDYLGESADGYLPVYTNEIISDWAEMPSEFDNTWREYGLPSAKIDEISITGLMIIDLYNHYREQAQRAYNEIKSEKGEL
jgi:hypothetical protein